MPCALLHDFPPAVGGWRITCKEIAPDGIERPISIMRVGTGQKEFTPEVDVKIQGMTELVENSQRKSSRLRRWSS